MFNVVQLDVTTPANSEVQSAILVNTPAEPKKIIAVRTTQNAADVDLIVNVDQRRIVDIPSTCFALAPGWLEINQQLKEGGVLAIGYRNGTGAPIIGQTIVIYEIAK